MMWEQGRNLTFLMMGTSYVSFEYNDQGIRTSKTLSNGTTYNYVLDGTRIVAETWSDELLIYLYDDNGSPIGMQSRYSGYAEGEFDTYWFEKNLQGDIIAVYDEEGTKLVEYLYDAWGNFTTEYFNLGEYDYALDFNPFRYRGYYYDEETGFYYLNSRYYDPVTGRFINPDNIAVLSLTPDALTDKNLYAYCDNNPVMRADHGGEFWQEIGDLIVEYYSCLINSIELELGWGWGIGKEVQDVGIESYNDTTIGFDDGVFYAGHATSQSAEIGFVGLGDSYMHYTNYGDMYSGCSHGTGRVTIEDIKACEYTKKTTTFSVGPFTINQDKDVSVGVSASAHAIYGFHASAYFNVSDFLSGIKNIICNRLFGRGG